MFLMQKVRSAQSIYVIKSAAGPVKIGISVNVKLRFRALQNQSSVLLSLPFIAKCSSIYAETVEATVHQILQSYRWNGEWFDVSVEKAIDTIKEAAERVGCELTPYSVETARISRQQQLAISSRQRQMRKSMRLPLHEELRNLLIERRKRLKLSQEEVAARLGRTQNYVSRIERGDYCITVIELVEIAEALGFDPMAAVRRVVKAKGKGVE